MSLSRLTASAAELDLGAFEGYGFVEASGATVYRSELDAGAKATLLCTGVPCSLTFWPSSGEGCCWWWPPSLYQKVLQCIPCCPSISLSPPAFSCGTCCACSCGECRLCGMGG